MLVVFSPRTSRHREVRVEELEPANCCYIVETEIVYRSTTLFGNCLRAELRHGEP